ncbi:LysR family transcriptional regulator [Rhodococcus sp. 14C212]|uniref:LysR substrate-binding domain-containing protein n=1 Tax=Rhodococcus sp. 14C212 TaxID=2711209 RepID=UPI0013EACF45|nr:LysR family transcriptional regulator [Rhodococcus sp. 14C212]
MVDEAQSSPEPEPLLDLAKLNHFVIVARSGSFVDAAGQLGLSQPALSRSIQSLERHLGVRLLERSRAGVELSAAGKQLIARAEDLLYTAQLLRREVTGVSDGTRGSVAFGIGPSVGSQVLPHVNRRLLSEYPGIHSKVVMASSAEMSEQLVEGEIEFYIGLADHGAASARISSEQLGEVTPAFLVRKGHPLLSNKTVTLEMLADYPKISGSAWARRAPMVLPGAYRSIAPVSLEVDNQALLIDAALSTDAILSMSTGAELPGLVLLPVRLDIPSSVIGLHWVSSRTFSPAALTVRNLISEVIKTMRIFPSRTATTDSSRDSGDLNGG